MWLLRHSDRTSRPTPVALTLFFSLTALFWGASIASCIVSGMRTGDWDAAFRPVSFPFPFMDFFCYVRRFQHVHQLAFFDTSGSDLAWAYPAPCALLYLLLYQFLPADLNPDTLDFSSGTFLLNPLSLAVLPFLILTLALFARSLRRSGLGWRRAVLIAGGLAVLSWPLFFALQRGNLDALLWFPLLGGIWSVSEKRYTTGSLLIGFASAFKLYPVVLLALLLPHRRFRPFLWGVGAVVLTSLSSLIWLGPTLPIALVATRSGIAHFASQYTLRYDPVAIGYDHSLFACLKSLMPSANREHWPQLTGSTWLLRGGQQQ